MNILAAIFGVLLVGAILQDGFETVVLPRRVTNKFRLARIFFRSTWAAFAFFARRLRSNNRRDYVLSFYGPLSLLLLLALWAVVLVFAFALLQWSLGSVVSAPGDKEVTFFTDLYMSGTTFFTLGYGDVVPRAGLPRLLAVVESGVGFMFLALIIGYVPIIYQAFSRREAEITLLDARAGSPPSVYELLRRHLSEKGTECLSDYLRGWEHWCAELLESHLSYPVLTYYRSQHDRQSWLAAIATILDVCALMMLGLDGLPKAQSRFIFAIARHAVVDLAQVYGTRPAPPKTQRLTTQEFARLRDMLDSLGIHILDEELAEVRLASIRSMYEPYLYSLSEHLLMPLPEWVPSVERYDDWQTSPWDHFAMTIQKPVEKVHQ